VTVGILEVQAAAPIPVIHGSALSLAWICPVGQVLFADAAEGSVKFLLADQERVVLRSDLPAGIGEVKRDAIVRLDHEKPPEAAGRRQPENPAQERRRPLLVTAGDNGVIQLDAHARVLPWLPAIRTIPPQGTGPALASPGVAGWYREVQVTEGGAAAQPAWPAGAAWIDGRYCPIEEAKISVLDLGLTRSDSHEDPRYSTPVRYDEPDGQGTVTTRRQRS